MKKIICSVTILAIAFVLTSSRTNAQSFSEGTNVVNAGIGFGYYFRYSGWGSTPVFSASFEHGVAKLGPGIVGVGAVVSFQGYSYLNERGSTFFVGARGVWHPDFLNDDKYDVYGGLQLGYIAHNYSYDYAGAYGSGIWPGIVIGGRYYFTDNVGAFAELGYDISYFKVGLSFKFGE